MNRILMLLIVALLIVVCGFLWVLTTRVAAVSPCGQVDRLAVFNETVALLERIHASATFSGNPITWRTAVSQARAQFQRQLSSSDGPKGEP